MRSEFALLFSSTFGQEDLPEIIYRMKGKLNISLGQDMSQFRYACGLYYINVFLFPKH